MKTAIGTLFLLMTLSIISCNKNTGATEGSNGTDTSSSGSNPDPIDVSSCAGTTGIEQVICLADAFKAQLDATQLAAVQLIYSTSYAKKWSNLPQALVSGDNKRIGLNFGAMTTTQVQYAKALLKAVGGVTADEGWDELQQLLNADEYLNENGGGSTYGAANYYIAFLGTPAVTGTFEIQYGGHHTAFANTYTNGVLVGATPPFRGVEPFTTFTWNGKSNQPLQQEQATLSAMLTGLSSTELTTAKLSSTYSDLVAGPQKDGAFPTTSSGIKCSDLSSDEKLLVLNAIRTYVNDVADAPAILSKYTGEINDTYISYSGSTGLTTRNDYVRIDGTSVWIEYSCQGGIVLSGTHPHSVWRDKSTDYGGN